MWIIKKERLSVNASIGPLLIYRSPLIVISCSVIGFLSDMEIQKRNKKRARAGLLWGMVRNGAELLPFGNGRVTWLAQNKTAVRQRSTAILIGDYPLGILATSLDFSRNQVQGCKITLAHSPVVCKSHASCISSMAKR